MIREVTGTHRRRWPYAALPLVVAAIAAAPAGAATTSFTTAGEHPYMVPAGVTEIAVTAIGGRGASTDGDGFQGNGARIRSRLTVSPGQTLYAIVGGNASGRTPGYNGGGAVGAADVCPRGPGAGGGASDIRTKPLADPDTAGSRILVAGGGGGTGGPGTHIFVIPADENDPELRRFDAWGGTGGDRGNAGRPGSGDIGFDGTPDPQPGVGGRGARGTGDPAGAGARTGTTTDGGTGGIASDTDYGCGGGGGGGYGGGAGGGAAQETGGGGGGGGGGSLDPAGNWFSRPAAPDEQPSIVIDDDPPAIDGVLDLTPDVYVSTKNTFSDCSVSCGWCTLPENGQPDGGCQQLAADAGNFDAGYRSQQAWGTASLIRARRDVSVLGIHPETRTHAGLGEPFVLGNLAHFNEPVRDLAPPTSIGLGGFVTLRLPAGDPISVPIGRNTLPNSNFPAVQLEFLETDNDPPCDPSIQVSNTPCDDHWRINDDQGVCCDDLPLTPTPVTVKGVTFQFQHLGFKKADDTFVKTLSTEERQITAADFYGKITASSNATTTALDVVAGPQLKATVSPAPWTGDGTVAFRSGGDTIAGCGAVAPDPSTGVATCTPSSLGPGTYSVKAEFSGGVGFAGSQSAPQTLVVGGSQEPSTLTVDDDKVQCPTAGYTSIQAAVAAAGSGDTINVCRGTYTEAVNVGTGKDGLSLVSSTSIAAAVVKGGFALTGGVQDVSIQRFRIEPPGGGVGVQVNAGTSSKLVRSNLVVGGAIGVAVVAGNGGTIRDNSLLSQTGNGVYVAAGSGHSEADVMSNTVTGTPSSSGIVVAGAGGTVGGTVFGNTVSKNGISGIATGGAGTMAIKANTVFQNGSGITTNGLTAAVENNKVSGNSGTGIATTTGGSTFTSNNAKSNGGADCSDTSTGSGTAATANIWTGNYGLDPSPAGICKK